MAAGKVTVILPVLGSARLSRAFAIDVAEAVKQIRYSALETLLVLTRDDELISDEALLILNGAAAIELKQIDQSSTILDAVQTGFEWCLAKGSDALILFPGGMLAPNALSELCAVAALDPAFGLLVPHNDRADDEAGRSVTEPSADQAYLEYLERVQRLPRWSRNSEPGAQCVYITNVVLQEYLPLSPGLTTWGGALVELASRLNANRIWTVTVNSAFQYFPVSEGRTLGIVPNASDLLCLETHFHGRREASSSRADSLTRLMAFVRSRSRATPSLLVDLSTLGTRFDPATDLAKEITSALCKRQEWAMTVSCCPRAASHHELSKIFPDATITTHPEGRCYSAAIGMSHPVSLSDFERIASASAVNVFLMTDILSGNRISGERSGDHLNTVLQLLGACAEGLIFVGSSSAERFGERYPELAAIPSIPILPSLSGPEYTSLSASHAPAEHSALIVGVEGQPASVNDLVRKTTQAMPHISFIAVGPFTSMSSNVQVLEPKRLGLQAMELLAAQSEFVLFPYFTDGISLVAAKALAAGRVVLVKASPLYDEVLDSWSGTGALVGCSSIPKMFQQLRALDNPATRHKLLSNFALERQGRATRWKWPKIAALVSGFLREQMQRRVDISRIGSKLRLLETVTRAVGDDRDILRAGYEATIKELEQQLAAHGQRIKELEAANTLLVTSRGYQLGQACSAAIESIPGLRSLKGK